MIKKAPKKDARREYCNLSFINADIVFIKANGKRVHLSKNGKKEKCHVPNIYLHYSQWCLKGYDDKFRC